MFLCVFHKFFIIYHIIMHNTNFNPKSTSKIWKTCLFYKSFKSLNLGYHHWWCNENSQVLSRPYKSSKEKRGRRNILAQFNLVYPLALDEHISTRCEGNRTITSQVQPLWNTDPNNVTSMAVMEVTSKPFGLLNSRNGYQTSNHSPHAI